jgi:outer membrane protein OmpA-like peptidoglycan-associated protein
MSGHTTGFKRLPLLVLSLALCAAPARAQVAGHVVEASGGLGFVQYDSRDMIRAAGMLTGSLGYRWSPALTFEGAWIGSTTKRDVTYPFGEVDHTWTWSGVDVRWNLRDPSEHVTPYLITGFGYGRSHDPDVPQIAQMGAPSAGMGVILNIKDNERLAVRFQVRDVLMREFNADNFSNHIHASVAIQISRRGKSKDSDLDGVRNWLDKEPNSPIGAKVNAEGKSRDSDSDGVPDGIDKCENTPKGAKVDKTGCPLDSDGDGVPDGVDQCDSTMKGAKVDLHGCPMDSDGDGVLDGIDQCENTPKGAVVDAKGCPVDSDGDGVADGIDKCPNTPAGLKVDVTGCPVEVSEKETELLDTGMIRLQDVNFETGKAVIKQESFPVLDDVAKVLLQYPMLTMEVGGHTDNTGTKAKNVSLSEQRAKAVMGYLEQKYPTLDPSHFTAVGYGPDVPVASNGTALGRAKNRRVEFRVTNKDVLKIEREKRHFVPKDGAAPVPPEPKK